MKKKIVGILVCALLILANTALIGTVHADWDEGDGHKMHWPQLLDLSPNGIDVDVYWVPLADDWNCSE